MSKKIVFDAQVSEKKILIVPTHTIKSTPYNPAIRTKEGKKLNELIEEIKNRGLIYPILITADRDVIDGNRRLAACRHLGHETIECIISEINRDQAFTVVNTTAMTIGGKGWLEIGMGGGYLPPAKRKDYDRLHNLIGDYGIKMLIDRSIGFRILRLFGDVVSVDAKYNQASTIIKIVERKLTKRIELILSSDFIRAEKVAAIDLLFKD